MFFKLDIGRYRAQQILVEEGIPDPHDCLIAGISDFYFATILAPGSMLAFSWSVVEAILRSEAIEVQYQSISNLEPRWRWMAPHAIAFDGFHWHNCACNATDAVFKDFVLSRILEIRGSCGASDLAERDKDWHIAVTLEIGPHPALSDKQAKVIALCNGMKDGKEEIRVRRAILYYALRRLGLDTDPAARQRHNEQIVPLNREAAFADRKKE